MSPQSQRASHPQGFTSSDSEAPNSYCPPESQALSSVSNTDPHKAFVIEFFDDNPRKKRSQSFNSNNPPPDPSNLRVQLERTRKSSSPVLPAASTTPSTQRYTVPLKSPASTGPQRAGSLRREKTDVRISSSALSRNSYVSVKPFYSVGRRSKLAQEFTAELLKQEKQASSSSLEKNTSAPPTKSQTGRMVVSKSDQRSTSPPPNTASNLPQTSSPIHKPVPLKVPVMPPASQSAEVKSTHVGPRTEEEDSLSDAGTYTIEADLQDKELEDARSKIDQASLLLHYF